MGSLEEITGLARGSRKLTLPDARRQKLRATGVQTRELAKAAQELGRDDIADTFIVSRQFALRYGAEAALLAGESDHSRVEIKEPAQHSVAEADIILLRRKMCDAPVTISRRCICAPQGRALCGVCVLRRRWSRGRIFPDVTYEEGLAVVKAAAQLAGLPNPLAWGTHAFRRGWADEVLAAGGPGALFYSGGWRGVAAFGYANARTRSAMLAAEFCVEHSDSEED